MENALKNKKKLVKMFWSSCFFPSLLVVGMSNGLVEKFEENWIKAILTWISTSLIAMLFYVVAFYFSLFYQVRKTEREVRKLIYEDLLDKIEKERPHFV